MNITSIELKHTNPSLGPHEKIVILTLPINVQTINSVSEFLGLSIINGVVELKEYLEAKRNNNIEVINKVEQRCNFDLNVGSPISHLTFHFEDGKHVEISDVYRCFNISHFYPDFTQYMVDKGSKIK